MKRFMLCLLLFPLAVMAQAPSFPVRLDLQSQSRTFALKWAAGSSPILSAYVSDGGRAYTNLSGWTGYVYVAVTPTAGVYVAASPVASNRVNFSFTASQTATVGVFNVEVVLGNGTNTYRWGTGSLALSNSPALLGAGTVPLTGVFNWDLYTFTGTQPPLSASYTNALAGDVTGTPDATVIGDGAVGTNKLTAEVRGLLFPIASGVNISQRVAAVEGAYISGSAASNSFVPISGGSITNWRFNVSNYGLAGQRLGYIAAFRGEESGQNSYIQIQNNLSLASIDYDYDASGKILQSVQNGFPVWTNAPTFSAQNLSNPPAAWTNSGNSATLGNYLPTDFVLLTTLSTGGYLRITSGAVTSNSMPGTRGEYRRTTTNAYFHDGSQWVTWSVSTNFSH